MSRPSQGSDGTGAIGRPTGHGSSTRLSSQTATSRPHKSGTRAPLRQRLHTHLGMLIRATARAIDWILIPGERDPSAPPSRWRAAERDGSAHPAQRRELVPVRPRSARAEDRQQSQHCRAHTFAIHANQVPDSLFEGQLLLRPEEYPATDVLPFGPYQQNHPATYEPLRLCRHSGCCFNSCPSDCEATSSATAPESKKGGGK